MNVAISPTETKDDLIILLKSSNKDSPELLLTKVFLTWFPTIIKIDVLIAINWNSENCLFSTFAPPKYIYNCNETWNNDSICDSHAVTKVTFMCPSAELTWVSTWVFLVLKLQISKPYEKFRVIYLDTIFILCIDCFRFWSKNAQFQNKSRINLDQLTQVNSSLGHINVTINCRHFLASWS